MGVGVYVGLGRAESLNINKKAGQVGLPSTLIQSCSSDVPPWAGLQERAAKWRTSDGLMDGLTTNGVLVMHPAGEFVSEPAPGVWREISVCGNVFALRETRSAQQRGKLVRTGQGVSAHINHSDEEHK